MKRSQKQSSPQLKMPRFMSMKLRRKTTRRGSDNSYHSCVINEKTVATAPGTSKRRRSLPKSLRLTNLMGRSQEAQFYDGDSTASTHSYASSIDSNTAGIVFHSSTDVVVSLHEDDTSIDSASLSDLSHEAQLAPSSPTLAPADSTDEGPTTQPRDSSVISNEQTDVDSASNDQASNTAPSRVRSRRSTLDMLQNLNIQDALQHRVPRRASAPETTNTQGGRNQGTMFSPPSEMISSHNHHEERPTLRGHSSERHLVSRQSDVGRISRPALGPFSSERNVSSLPSLSLRQETPSMVSVVRPLHANGSIQAEMPPSLPANNIENAGNDHAGSASVEDMPLSGSSMLYHAVSSGAPPHVIQSIVDADPSSVGLQNNGGHTALHCGIERYDTPLEVIQILIEANPKAVCMKNRNGFTPLDLIWKRFVSPEEYRSQAAKTAAARLRASMKNVVSHGVVQDTTHVMSLHSKKSDQAADVCEAARRQKAKYALDTDRDFRQFWDLITLAIRAANQDTSTRQLLVHGAVIANCPSLLIRFAAALHPEQLRQREEKHGRLPLHLAAVADSPRFHESETIAESLLSLYPGAASCHDHDGRLPIALALENGHPWEGCIRELFMAWPQSLSMQDEVTQLVPFMLSAVGEGSDMNTIFSLLREGPLEVMR